MDALNTCNICDAEIKTPNSAGYCDDCRKPSINWQEVGPESVQALKDLTERIDLRKLNVKKDYHLLVAHAQAIAALRRAEGKV